MNRRYLSNAFYVALVLGLIIVFLRAYRGPFQLFVPVNSPLNCESLAAISLMAISLLRTKGRMMDPVLVPPRDGASAGRRDNVWLSGVLLLTAACFWPFLGNPLVSDDYILASRALHRGMPQFLFTHGGGDGWFRPIGALWIASNALWADVNPFAWHLLELLVHLANCVIVYCLARMVYLPSTATIPSAAIFAIHGTRPEAVGWMTAQFDLLATLFFLGAMLLFLRYCDRPNGASLAGCAACLLFALLTKESAYSFPVVALLLLGMSRRGFKRNLTTLVFLSGLAMTAFIYRWFLFTGIGGYIDPSTGRSTFWNFNLLRALKTLGWRVWAILFFPINWSRQPGIGIALGIICLIPCFLILATARAPRARMLYSIAVVLALMLPRMQFFLVGQDLLGARLYYLPVVGFALLAGLLIGSVNSRTQRRIASVALVTFFVMALRHNLNIWRPVSELAERTCVNAAREIRGDDPVRVEGLPRSIRGVYFFQNGFPECISLNSGPPSNLVTLAEPTGTNQSQRGIVFRWNEDNEKLVRVK